MRDGVAEGGRERGRERDRKEGDCTYSVPAEALSKHVQSARGRAVRTPQIYP